jgi:hypothetical protein
MQLSLTVIDWNRALSVNPFQLLVLVKKEQSLLPCQCYQMWPLHMLGLVWISVSVDEATLKNVLREGERK